MKPTFRCKGIADMHAVNEESASTFVLAASTMSALGRGTAQCEGNLLAPVCTTEQ